MIIPASHLLLEKGNKVLLSRRFNTGFKDGQYSFVSGHVEQGEPATAAIIREAKEEANVTIKKEDLDLIYVLHRKSDYKAQERVDFFFKTKKWKGKIKNNEPKKCDDLAWFDKKKLPSNTMGHLKKVLKEIEKGKTYGEDGW